MKEREKQSNKDGDLLEGPSPLSHVISGVLTEVPQVIFSPCEEELSASAPSTSTQSPGLFSA